MNRNKIKRQLSLIASVVGTGAIFGTLLRLLTRPSTGWFSIILIGTCLGMTLFLLFVIIGIIFDKLRRPNSLSQGLEVLGRELKPLLSPFTIIAALIMGAPYWLCSLLAALTIHLFDYLLTEAAIPAKLGWITSGMVYGAALGLVLAGFLSVWTGRRQLHRW